MIRLLRFEILKIWKKRSFLTAVAALFVINLFLLWYTNLPDEETPPLSAYKQFSNDISTKNEEEKEAYFKELEKALEYGQLRYTNSLVQETALVDKLYEEFTRVSGYREYLSSIRESKKKLSGISIFQGRKKDTFSSQNIEKSAADYASLKEIPIRWQPSKGIEVATESRITDLLMFLSLFLFVGGLITEEKGLFYVTRATRHGIAAQGVTKLSSLLIHSIVTAAVMMGGNLIFAEITAGTGDWIVSIQSLAPYMESGFFINILEYLLVSVLTKGVVLFCFGLLLTIAAVGSKKAFMPYLTGIGILGISEVFYRWIPDYSWLCPLKYMNFAGLMETAELYGGYLNLNIGGIPVGRWSFGVIVLIIMGIAASSIGLFLFVRGNSLEVKKFRFSLRRRCRPCKSLFSHEAYKMLIANRGIFVLLCFVILLGYHSWSHTYYLSAGEQYYQNLMLQLEGKLNEKKEAQIRQEQKRYEDARARIQTIDGMVEQGEIDSDTAGMMKWEWESVLSFYPSFQRVEQQYERILQNGGEFVYDTGYLYLLGINDESYHIDLLLLFICMVITFYNGISMEYSKKSWFLLGATRLGRKKIIIRKVLVCIVCGVVMTLVSCLFQYGSVAKVFPMNQAGSLAQCIPYFKSMNIQIPIWGVLISAALLRILAVCVAGVVALGISAWRKNDMQSFFFGMLILVFPFVLKLMGIDAAGWIKNLLKIF